MNSIKDDKVNCNKIDNNNAGDNYVHSIMINKLQTKMVIKQDCFTHNKQRKINYGNYGNGYSKD